MGSPMVPTGKFTGGGDGWPVRERERVTERE